MYEQAVKGSDQKTRDRYGALGWSETEENQLAENTPQPKSNGLQHCLSIELETGSRSIQSD